MKRLLVVVDFQNDFVCGSLGFEKAKEYEKKIVHYIKEYKNNGDDVFYTMDTHQNDYLKTYEGIHLPIEHCIEGTTGWELYGETKELLKDCLCFKKETFPSLSLANYLTDKDYKDILLVGLVSHICVLSNAIMIKSALPQTPIKIDIHATGSSDEKTHQESLNVLKSLQIEIIE